MQATVGHDHRPAGHHRLGGVEGLDGVQSGGGVVHHQAVRTGQDGLVEVLAVGVDPDGDGTGLDIGHVVLGGGLHGDDRHAGVAPVGVEHHVDQLVRHPRAEVQHPPDAGSPGTGGLQDLAVGGEDVHVHHAVLFHILCEGLGGGHVLDPQAGERLLVQAGQELVQGDGLAAVLHGEVGVQLPHQGGGAALRSGHVGGGSVLQRDHGGRHDQAGLRLVDLGLVAVLSHGQLGGQVGQVGGHPQAGHLGGEPVEGEGDLAVDLLLGHVLGPDDELVVDIFIDVAVPVDDSELIGLFRVEGLAVRAGMGDVPGGRGPVGHHGELHAVGGGGVLAHGHLPEGEGVLHPGGVGLHAVGEGHPAGVVHRADHADLRLDAHVPAEVPHRQDHVLIGVAGSAGDMEGAAGDIGGVAARHAGGGVVHERGVVEGELHLTVDVEGHLGGLAVLLQGQEPAPALFIPGGLGGDRLVVQQGGGLLLDGLGGDGLGALEVEGPLHHGLEIGGQGVGIGGLSPLHSDIQLLGGGIAVQAELGLEAAVLAAGDLHGAALSQECGVRQGPLDLPGQLTADVAVRGAGGHLHGEGIRHGVQGGVQKVLGLELQGELLPVHGQGQGLGAQSAADHGQLRHAVHEGDLHLGLAVALQRHAVKGQVGHLRLVLAQEAAAVQSRVGRQLLLAQGPVVDADAVVLGLGLVVGSAQTAAQDDILRLGQTAGGEAGLLLTVQIPGAHALVIVQDDGGGGAQGVVEVGAQAGGVGPLLELHGLPRRAGEDAPGVAGFVHGQEGGVGGLIAAVALLVHEVLHRVFGAVDGLRGALGQEDLAVVQPQPIVLEAVLSLAFRLVRPVDLHGLAGVGQVRPGACLAVRALQAVQTQDQAVGHILLGDGLSIAAERDGLRAVERGIPQVDGQYALPVQDQAVLSRHRQAAGGGEGGHGERGDQQRPGTEQAGHAGETSPHAFYLPF